MLLLQILTSPYGLRLTPSVDWININSVPPFHAGLILSHIWKELIRFPRWRMTHIWREANQGAAVNHEEEEKLYNEGNCPLELKRIMVNDIGVDPCILEHKGSSLYVV